MKKSETTQDETVKTTKSEKVRQYHGADATSVDAGRPWKDPMAIVPITAPFHSMHDRCDFERYEPGNPQFASLCEVVGKRGPMMIKLRQNGFLPHNSPQYKYLLEKYPGKVRKEEPQMEVVYGNSRLLALLTANARRVPRGLEPWRQKYEIESLSDAEASEVHAEENLIRQGNSLWNNVLLVQSHRKGGGAWEGMGKKFGLPDAEAQRLYEPLLSCERCLVDAFGKGQVSLSILRRLSRQKRSEQAQQLHDYLHKEGAFAPKTRTPRAEKPDQLPLFADEKGQLIRHLEQVLASMEDPLLSQVLRKLRGEEQPDQSAQGGPA